MTVVFGFRGAFEKLLVIGVFMLGVETCAQTEVGEFDMAFRV